MNKQEKINQYRGLYNKYEDLIHEDSRYSQLTIDFVQNNESDFSEYESDYPDFIEPHIGAILYRLQNIIEVIKEGIDKDLLIKMAQEFEEVYRK